MGKIHDIGGGTQISSIVTTIKHVSSAKIKLSAAGKRACAKILTPCLNTLKASLESFHYPSWHSVT